MRLDRCPINSDEKKRMVARAAYFRFADRGFTAGDPKKDWLDAEAQIEQAIDDDCNLPPRKGLVHTQRWGLMEAAAGWWQRIIHWPTG